MYKALIVRIKKGVRCSDGISAIKCNSNAAVLSNKLGEPIARVLVPKLES